MALIFANRVKVTDTTTGTGAFSNLTAITGYQTFNAVLASADKCYYTAVDVNSSGVPTGDWECGIGHRSVNTLTRDIILASSNSGAAVSFAAGTRQIFMDLEARNAGDISFASANGARNVFVDGIMEQWNAGTTVAITAADTYAGDLWVCNAGTGGTGSVSRTRFATTIGTDLSNSPMSPYFEHTYSQTATASTAPTVGQKIERVRTLSGKSATFSVTLLALSAQTITGVQVTQNFGTGGSPATTVVTSKTVSWALAAGTAKRYSVRLDIPAADSASLGTNGDDFTRVDLLLPLTSGIQIHSCEWQLEISDPASSADTTGIGGAPTNFEYRGRAMELERAQRSAALFNPTVLALLPPAITTLKGTVLADNAAAGSVGEVITATASSVASPTGTIINITSISLTPGDWDVIGYLGSTAGGATMTSLVGGGISTTSATLPTYPGYTQINAVATVGSITSVACPSSRINISTTTTVFLVGFVVYTLSTCTLNGTIRARRMR